MEARGVEATTVVVLDTATDGVLHAADELNIDLIAIGTHGHGGFKRMVLGSTADAIVRRSGDLPCLVLRAKEEEAEKG